MGKDRQWVERAISHQATEAVPYYFDFTPPAQQKIESYYGSPVEERLGFPIRMGAPKSVKIFYADPEEFGKTIKDEFGVIWSTSKIDRGAPIGPCLAEPTLSGYKFPDPSASYRFEHLADWCDENREHYRIIWVADFWERATFMRGMENILRDLVLNPGFAEKLLHGIAEYALGTLRILFDRFEFEGIALSDDYGAQKSMVMSPAHWARFVKPGLQKIYEFAKTHGRTILHHADGYIYPIIGDLIDLGCDILHPVQHEFMDVFKLKQEFGSDLTFFGGIRTQDLLSKGTDEEIREAVRRLKREMGRNGGHIISSGITIQADVPLDNMVAMIDEAIHVP